MEFPTLRAIRRIYGVFFFSLFALLLVIADFRWMRGYEIPLFLEINPLTALTALLTSGTLYKGLALALIIVIPTLFMGRFFCSWICPLGILNQWLSALFHGRRAADHILENRYKPIFRLKYYLLAVIVALAAAGTLQSGVLDPIALISRSFITGILPATQQGGGQLYLHQPLFQGGVVIALIFLAILLANRFMARFWCRVVCPLGALLGLLSLGSVLRIRRDVERCTNCMKCLHGCQGGCDPDGALRISECHVCMNCVEQCPEGALHFGLSRAKSSRQVGLDIYRRRLVETTVAALTLFPMWRSSVSAQALPDPRVIRPPGALPEKAFLARCIKCAVCMRVCPTNVLQPTLLESGLEGVWTPILLNRIGYCEHHCVLCGQVCPTAAIRPISVAEKLGAKPFTAPIKLGTAFFDRGRCLPWAMQIPCIVCEEVCPTSPKAIWYETKQVANREGKPITLKQPFVEPTRCIGCGVCENKCPVTDQAAIRVTAVGESRSERNQMIL